MNSTGDDLAKSIIPLKPVAAIKPSMSQTRAVAAPPIHLVGCCGSGMKGLADLLAGFGHPLSGSDQAQPSLNIQRLIDRGQFQYVQGHRAENLPPQTSRLIHSLAIPSDNPERQEALRRGLPQLSYSQAIGEFMADRIGVCIAGTHGKSTTTALTAWLLQQGGLNPSAIFGANLCGECTSSWSGHGPLFVVESCEFQRSFLDYRPRYAAILSVEPDHFDCFGNTSELHAAFASFAARVDSQGFVLVSADDPAALAASRAAAAPVLTFGTQPEADWWATDVRRTAFGMRFRIFRQGSFVMEGQVPLFGRHNVMNTLAAIAMSVELGVSPCSIRSSLMEFPGLERRFQQLGSWRGVSLVDDYAHHPTAVAVTLQTARELFGQRKIYVAMQLHQASRTRALIQEFAGSFREADEVLLAPIFTAREQPEDDPAQLPILLARQICENGTPARTCTSLDHLTQVLEDTLKPGDVLITMGAGDIDRIQHAFTRRLSRDSAAGRTISPPHLAEGGWSCSVFSYSA